MPAYSQQSHNRFAVEGLESRILLSAVPMDAVMEVEESPKVYEVQYMTEAAEGQGGEGQDSLWEGARALPAYSADSADEANAPAALTVTADGVLDASGQLVQTIEAGMELVAGEIHVADGAVLDSISLQAEVITLGEITWSGANQIDAAELYVDGPQTALTGATLQLTPGADEAPIYLGQLVDEDAFGLDQQALSLLSEAGFAHLTIGSESGSHLFMIDGLAYDGNLTLQASVGEGSFNVLSEVVHSGGTLTYVGTGSTQVTSADTLTEGAPLEIDDSLELAYTVDNENVIRIDTTDNGNTQGADISITGDILGSDEAGGGTLILNAGTDGTILIGGNIGTSKAIEKIVIENAAQVIIEGNIQVQEFEILNGGGDVLLGTSASNFVNIEGLGNQTGAFLVRTESNITINGDFEMVNGDATFGITGAAGTRQLWIKGEVGVDDGDLVVERANRVLMSNDVVVSGALSQLLGLDNTRFESNVSAGSIDLRANNQIRFVGSVLLLAGDLTLVTNNIDFRGGSASVSGALNQASESISDAFFRPSSTGGEMNIGSPVGAGSNFTFSSTDIAALENGWSSITFGYETGATNLARIGTATFLDAVTIHAGSTRVNGPLAARTSLTMNAATGNMTFTNGAQTSVVNEQIGNIWQESFIAMTAAQGDILFSNGAFTAINNSANPVTGTPASTITMTATLGDIRDQSATPGFQEARDMELTAGGDIFLYTRTANMWAESTVAGNIEIFELNGLRVHSAITENGRIEFDTGGLTQVDFAESRTDAIDNTVAVSALGSILVGEILAGVDGDVTLTAEDAITRIAGLADPDHRIVGNLLTMVAETGIGQIAAPLLIRTNSLNAENLTSGDIRITHDAQRTALEVRLDNASSGAGDLVSLDVLAADVLVTDITNESDGGVFVEVAGELMLNGSLLSEGGPVSVAATETIELAAASSIQSSGGDVALLGAVGVVMAVDASIVSSGGQTFLSTLGNILLGSVDARDDAAAPGAKSTWGSVALIAGGWLRDHSGSSLVNVYGNELHMRSDNGIGELPAPGGIEQTIEVDAGLLAAFVGISGDIALKATSDLVTGVPQAFAYDLLDRNGAIQSGPFGSAPLAGVLNEGSDGAILISADGSLTLQSNELAVDASAVATTAAGTVVLVADQLDVEDAILSNGGSISADVTGAISLAAGVSVATSGSGTIAFRSSEDSILAAADSAFVADATAIVLSAQDSIELGSVAATGGAVGLTATTGSLLAATGGVDARTVVTADALAIVAGGSVNGPTASGERFRVSVGTISLTGGTGSEYRLDNDRDLLIDTSSATADLFDSLMATGSLAVASQDNFAVSGEGLIELNVDGNLTLAANRTLSTTGVGSIELLVSGGLSMGALASISNADGAIDITAGATITVARIASTNGDIRVESENGAIIDSDPAETAVLDFATSGGLELFAADGIGIEAGARDALTVSIGSFSGTTVDGGVFIASADSFTVGDVLASGSLVPVVITSGGSLTFDGNVDATGDVVLRADVDFIQEASASIVAGQDVALRSGADMTLSRVETPAAVALEVVGSLMGYADPIQAAIAASALLLNEVGSVGTPALPLLTDIERLAGLVTAGALALSNESDLTVGAVTVETIPVGTADTLPLAPRVQSGDRVDVAGTGSGVFIEVEGSFKTESVVDASLEAAAALPVLVQSTAEQTWNGRFSLGDGAVTLRAGGSVTLDAGDTFSIADGSLLIESEGQFGLGGGSLLSRGTGDLLIDAAGNIVLAGQITGTGNVALLGGDSILVGADNSVQATDLILSSAQGIASASQALIADVDRLAVRTGASGVFLENSGALAISNLGFSIISLAPGAVENAAFSGFVGGVVAEQGGAIDIDNGGAVTVDPIAASIEALPGTDLAFSVLADAAGSAGNGVGVFIVRDDSEATPLTSEYSEEDRSLIIYVENGVNTLGEILDVINNHPEFPGLAVLSGGLADGATVFDVPALESTAFIAAGGSEDGIRSEVAGVLAEGAESVASSAQLLVPESFFTIRITSEQAGTTINNATVRLLNEGPLEVADGGRLNPGTDAAIIEWDGGANLDIYVNFGFTTVGTVIDRINEQVGIPFSAELGGTFDSGSRDVVLGDEPVLMESNLRASAILRPIGANNDFEVTASSSGPLFNGVSFVFLDDGTVPDDGAEASFNPVSNVMTLRIQSGVTTANEIVAALNLEGTFNATTVSEVESLNTGNGLVQAQRFLTTGGAVAVQASATLRMVGSDNDITLTANDLGDDFNGIEIRTVSNSSAAPGSVAVNYDSGLKQLTLTVNPLFTSAAQVVDAVNAASTPFTAASDGSGTFALAQYPSTSGGTGEVARAEFVAAGDNNDFEIVANSDSTALINTRVFLIDDGSITDGSASATYLNEPRHLIINLQGGATTANDVLAAINDASIPMTATLLSGNDGSGVYHVDAAVFAGGIDAISATTSVVLPSGAEATVTADEGGIAANGIEVAFAIDASLPTNSAAANWFEFGGKRLLQLRVDSAATELSVIANALAADAGIPFTLTGDLSTAAGDLAPMDGVSNEGRIVLTAGGAISLLGRVDSQTGRVDLVTSGGTGADLTFDSETARVEAIDGVNIDVTGSFANLESLEAPLVQVYGESLLSITTGSQSRVSTESVYFLSGGDLTITGAGLAIQDGFERDQSVRLEAANDVTVDAAIRTVASTVDADGIIFTILKSELDAAGNALSASRPVAIEEVGGNYTVYVLPDVATHANIIDAINALEMNELPVFFANLGRQDGTLVIGEHTFFITSLTDSVIQNVSIDFVEVEGAPAAASFAGTTLTLLLDAADNTTVDDVLLALNGTGTFAATTSTVDTSSFLRGEAARNFQSDYTVEIIADTEQTEPVVLNEAGNTFTLNALPGTATRLDLLNALTDSGLFAGSVPDLDARLDIGDFAFYLDTGAALASVNLQVGFVEEGTLEASFDEGTGVLDVTLNNVDAASGQDVRDALEALDFIVYSLDSDLSGAIDTQTAAAGLEAIPAGTRSAPLSLDSPITVTLPVGSEGVFADALFEVEGMLIALNWLVPAVGSAYSITTFEDSLSRSIMDDASGPSATLSYGATGVFASTILTVDGVDLAIAARSTSLSLSAGNDLSITSGGLLGGGTVDVEAGNTLAVAGAIEGGNIDLFAVNAISQSGALEATGTGTVNVISREGAIAMSGAASTASVSGPIFYQAAGAIDIVSITSTGAARIDIVSGAAITDALANDNLNISTGGFVALTAQTGIGAIGAGAINTVSGTIQLRNFGNSGDIVVTEAMAGAALTVSELTQNAVSGWSILSAAQGDVGFTGPVLHSSDGALWVQAANSILTQSDAPISLNGGLLTFLAGDSIELNADVTTAGGDAWLAAASGSLEMLAATTLNTDAGNALLSANSDVTIAQVQTSGSIRVESDSGSILRAALNDRTNLLATNLQLYAGLAVGSLAVSEGALITEVSLLNATAASGVLAVRERDDLAIGDSTVTVTFAEASRTSDSSSFSGSQWSQSGLGDSVLRVGGSLDVESILAAGPTLSVAGNLHVDVANAVTVDGAVELANGSLQWIAGNSFTLNADLSVTGGTVLLQAGDDFTQAADAAINVNNANTVIVSGVGMTVGSIDVGSGHLALDASAALVQQSDQLITAAQVRLSAGAAIASASDPFTFDAARISAVAGGSIFLVSANSLLVDTVAAIDVDTVTVLGAIGPAYTVDAQSDLTTTANNGSIVLLLDAGDLTLNGGLAGSAENTAVSAHGTGNILLDTPGQLLANADVRSGSGHISLLANNDLVLSPGADVLTSAAASLFIESATGAISMDDNSRFNTGSGDVVIQAAQDITLGGVSTSGSVAIVTATGAILDGGDTYTDVEADRLLLNAGSAIGTSSNALDISVSTVSARAANGGIFLSESDGLIVDDVTASVERVDAAAQTVTTPIAAQSDLVTLAGNGPIVVQLAAGNLALNDGTAALDGIAVSAHGSGNVLLQTLDGAFTADADVLSGSGHISLLATGAVLLADDVSVTTAGLGSLTLVSDNSTLTQNAGGTLTAADGDVILEANGNIRIAGMTTSGNVGIVAKVGSIIDNEATRINIQASDLLLSAGAAIGSGTNPIETEVNAVSADALDGGIFLAEADAINVTTTAAETSVVTMDASTGLKTLAPQSGLASAGSGSVVLLNQLGDITVVADNTVTTTVNGRILLDAANDLTVNANVSSDAGNITLRAGNDFTLAADMTATTGVNGEIHVIAGGLLDTVANSRLINDSGNVVLDAEENVVIGGVQSNGRVLISSATGSILAAGSDAFDREIIGSQLLLSAANGSVGTAAVGQTLRTQVGRLAAESLDGVYLTNAASLRVDSVTVPFRTVNADGSLAAELSVNLGGAVTANAPAREIRLTVETQNLTLGNLSAESVYVNVLAGSIRDGDYTPVQIVASEAELIAANSIGAAGAGKLDTQIDTLAASAGITVGSSIFLSDNSDLTIGTVGSTSGATAENGVFIEADGNVELNEAFTATSGNGLLQALSGDLTIDALITAGTHLSLLADSSILQNENLSAGGTLDIAAATGSVAMLDGVTAVATGNARITAATSILLGGLDAANIRLDAGTWIDTAGSSHTDLIADAAQLTAGSFIGQALGLANGPLQSSINSLAATTGTGSLYLSNDKSLVVAAVPAIDVNRVQIDNTAPVQAGSALAGISANQSAKVTSNGNLTIDAALSAENDDLLLQSLSGDLSVNAAVVAGDSASLLCSAGISLTAIASLNVGGSLDVQAFAGAFTMADGATVDSTGNLRVLVSGDIRLGGVTAANAYLDAGGAIIDNGDADADLTASQVQLIAGASIGEPAETNFGLIDITADALAVQSGGAVFVDDSGDLALTTVAPINVVRIGLDSSSTLQTGTTLSGLTATAAVILTTEGSLTIDQSVSTSSASNVLLEARTDASDLLISAPVSSVGGNLSLIAGRDLTLSGTADLSVTAAPGTIDLQARLGSIDQAADLTIQTTNANVLLQAAVDVSLGQINAGSASVGVVATSGSIVDNKARTDTLPNNITADALSLIAGGDIGLVGAGIDNALEIQVNRLTAATTEDGSIHIREFDSLLIDTVAAFTVNRVSTDNTTSTTATAIEARSDVRSAGNGHIILRSVGSMTLDGGLAGPDATTAVAAAGSGNVLIDVLAINGNIFANAQVLSDSGSISMLAGRGITLGGNANLVVANGTGTIDLNAARGDITQTASLWAETAGGNILFRARDNVQLGLLDARNEGAQSTWGLIGVIASTGSITDAKDRTGTAVNIVASAANLTAAGSIGILGSGIDNAVETDVLTLAAATTANGSLNIRESADLSIDTVASFTANRVASDATTGTSSTTVAARSDLRTGGDGAIVLRVNTGDLTLNGGLTGAGANEAVVATGSGGIRLETLSGSLTANADVLSGTGPITLAGQVNVDLSAAVDVMTAADISINAETGALTMDGAAAVEATGASARLFAALDLTAANITATNVSLVSGADIINAVGSSKNVTATNLRIEAIGSIASTTRHLTADIDHLTATAATGSIFLTEDEGVTVTDVEVTVTELLFDATTATVTDASQSDLTTGLNGAIILVSTLGDIALNDGADADGVAVNANGSGPVLIDALAGSLAVNADILSGSGITTLTANANLEVNAGVDLVTAADISIEAENGTLTMDGTANLEATSSSARLAAAFDLSVGNITAADVSLLSEANIINASGSSKNVTATNLRIDASDSVGAATRHLTTDIENLSVNAATGSIFITEDDGVTINDVEVSVNELLSDASVSMVTDGAQSDITTGLNGDIALVSVLGDITLNDGANADGEVVNAHGSGRIRIDALAGSLSAHADVLSSTGIITLAANTNVDLTAGVDIVSAADISINAETGTLTMAGTAKVEATAASARLSSALDLTLGNLTAANVSLVGDEAIINASGSSKNVTSTNLRIEAAGSVGAAGRHLSTNIANLSAASATGSVFITEDNGVTVTGVGVSVTEFLANATTTVVSDSSQADLTTGLNGDIVLLATLGNITLNDGIDSDGQSIVAHGSGRILMDALAASLTANADVLSGTGLITLSARVNVELTADADVVTAGDISIGAETGTLAMAGSAMVEATASSVRLSSAQNLTLGNVTAANVSLLSGEAIINASGSSKNVTATNLRIDATDSVGIAGRHLSTDISNLSAASETGSVFITEDNGVSVTGVAVSVTEFLANATTAVLSDESQSDLTTGLNGDIILIATFGNIALDDGTDSDGLAVVADGSGRILIEALSGSLTASADVLSETGLITLSGQVNVELSAGVDVVTAADISISAETGTLTMAGSAFVEATASSARLSSAQDLTLGNLTAADVSLLSGEAIINASGSSKNVTATNLRIDATASVGIASRHLTTNITNLSVASATGSIFITEDNGVTVNSVAVSVTEFLVDATTTVVSDSSQSDLITGLNGETILVATLGNIALDDGTNGDGLAVVADGSGRVLIEALSGSLTANAGVLSETGLITLTGQVDVELSAGVDVVTAADISISAETGTLTMDGSAIVEATASTARLSSAFDLTVGNVTAADVSLVSGDAIINASGSSKNVTSTNLRIDATSSVGSASRHLSTNITNLSAASETGSIFITEDNGVIVTGVEVSVTEFLANATTAALSDGPQSDLTTGLNGGIVLVTTLGNLTLNDGTDSDGLAVVANGSGRILMDALAGSLTANADVLSDTGLITLSGRINVELTTDADVVTAADISIDATTGALSMAGTAIVEATASSARLSSALDLLLGNVTAANVSLVSGEGIVNASGSSKNVTATNLRIDATSSVGIANRHLTTNITNLSAASATGSIFITEDNGVIVTDVAVSVTEFLANATATVLADGSQSDLTTGLNGDIVLVATLGNVTLSDGTDGDGLAVAADGSGRILMEALSGSLMANADILSGTGLITLSARVNVGLAAAVDVVTGADISIEAETGTLTMAAASKVEATASSSRLSSALDFTLASITADSVSLVTSGNLTSSLASGTNVVAKELRVSATGSVGAGSNPLTTSINYLSARSSTGSIYITETNGVTVRGVGVGVASFNADGTTSTVTDAAQSDLVTLADGDSVLLAALGNITLEDGLNSDGVAVSANGSGSISIQATAGMLIAEASVLSSTGSITLQGTGIAFAGTISSNGTIDLVATDGGIFRTDTAALINAGPSPLSLNATDGIGRTGSGALSLESSALTVNNSVAGSVYLNVLSAATIKGIAMAGRGDLYFNQPDHAVFLNGTISLEDGRVVLQTGEALTVAADLMVVGDIRLTSDSLAVAAGVSLDATGEILLRARNAIAFGIGSSAVAGDSLTVFAGADLSVAALDAGDRMDLRAGGSILHVDGALGAPFMRLIANAGSLGTDGNELLLAAGRLDVASATGLHLIQQGDVTIGRAGLLSTADLGETISLAVQSGTLTSALGEMRFDGSGTFLLDVDGELLLGSAVVADDGNIAIDTNQLSLGDSASGVILQAVNGRVTITSVTGIGAASGSQAEISIAADELSATTDSGSINLALEQATTILGEGVQIDNGAGTLNITSNAGDLTVNAPIRQMGTGAIDLAVFNGNLWINDIIRQNNGGSLTARVHNGHLTMGTSGRVETTSGAMNLRASSNVWLLRVQSTTGLITLRSDSESVRRVVGLSNSFANIISSTRPVVQVARDARFTVDSSSVLVNGFNFNRLPGDSSITISLSFQ